MLPDFPEITSIEDFTAWAGLLSTTAAFTGDTDLLEALGSNPETITVGQYLDLLDAAETSLLATDFSFLNTALESYESLLRQNLPQDTLPDGTTVDEIVDAALGFLRDLAAGDFSFMDREPSRTARVQPTRHQEVVVAAAVAMVVDERQWWLI
ncbi:hypothetical protein [Rhodophyticola sp.]|uniref:hypothetical protein n=1 Tax=Rhodophyticola sp. TaxID=2680032 RepID=UPI003D2C5EA2